MLPPRQVSRPPHFHRRGFIALCLATACSVPLLAVEGPQQQSQSPSSAAQAERSKSGGATNAVVLKAKVRLAENYGKLPLRFEANQGQADPRVRFLSRGRGYALFLTGDEAVLRLRNESAVGNRPAASGNAKLDPRTPNPESRVPSALRMKLVGADAHAQVVPLDELPGRSNYFRGNDPAKWRTNVPNYGKVKYQKVYPGVDLVYYGNQRQLEYDFVVAPGADPRAIRLAIETGNQKSKVAIDPRGDLVISMAGGEVRLHKPAIYQPKRHVGFGVNSEFSIQNSEPVEGKFKLLSRNRVGFEIASYDRSRPLVIDPVLSYSTFLGGSGEDIPDRIAVDSDGNAYVTGYTSSTDFPVVNPLQPASGGNQDAFIAKLNATGNALVYSTYLGGSSDDAGYGIAVDASGNIYLTGYTSSLDLPTASPLQPAFGGGNRDAFVAKLNATGNALVYSTYLGGSGYEEGSTILADASGNAYVTGPTSSTNFPMVSALQPAFGGVADVFIAKLNAAGSALVYSTYLGGSDEDHGDLMVVDAAGNAYLTGSTSSLDFPTVNPVQPAFGGGPEDGFVAKVNSAGSALAYSTYLGGSDDDFGRSIAVDAAGSAYVTGETASTNFPTASPLQPAFAGGIADGFLTKLNAVGNALVYSTYLGGSDEDFGDSVAVDSSGNAYVTGGTDSTDFPTVSPLQSASGGLRDAFVSKLNAAGDAFIFSTYLGGSGTDRTYGIALDSVGDAYVVGGTDSTDFPTQSPFQATNAGGTDLFVAKIGLGLQADSNTVALYKFEEAIPGTSYDSSGHGLNAVDTGTTVVPGLFGTARRFNGTSDHITMDAARLALNGSTAWSLEYVARSLDATQIPLLSNAECGNGWYLYAGATYLQYGIKTDAEAPCGWTALSGLNAEHASVSLDTNWHYYALTWDGSTLRVYRDGTEGANAPAGGTFQPTGAYENCCLAQIGWDTYWNYHYSGEDEELRVSSVARTGAEILATAEQLGLLAATPPAPVVALSPTAVHFTANPVGIDCDPKLVTLTNAGQAPVTIQDISFPAGSVFSQTHDCGGGVLPATLAAGEYCTISVKFHPVVAGPASDTLSVTTQAAGAPSAVSTVAASGTGTICTLSASSYALTVLRGTESAGVDIEDANPSCSPVDFSLTCTPDHPALCALHPAVIPPSGKSRLTVTNLRAVEASSVRVVVKAVSEFRLETTAVNVLLADFAFTSAPDTASVAAGQTANYALTVRPINGLSGPVSLTCSGAPRGARCTVTPASLTLDGASLVPIKLQVTTTGRAAAPGAPWGLPPLTGRWGLTLLGLLAALLAGAAAGHRRRRLTAALLAGTLLMLLGWAACGAGGGSVSLNSGATPAGTYALMVTGTYTNAPGSTPSALTSSTTVTLHVN